MRSLGGWLILITGVEIALLAIGVRQWGGTAVFAAIILTGLLGAYMSRREGRLVLQDVQMQLARGQVPAGSLLDGLCIFVGGLLLMAPGFLADITGFLLLLPATRPLAKLLLLKVLKRQIDKGRFTFYWRR